MIKKYVSMILVVLMLALALTGCGASKDEGVNSAAVKVGDDTAAYKSDDANEYSPTFKVKLIVKGAKDDVLFSGTVTVNSPNPVVLNALEAGLTEKGENWTDGGNGFITQISGYTNDSSTNYYWGYTVNGVMAHLSSADFQLRDGDIVEWTYSKME